MINCSIAVCINKILFNSKKGQVGTTCLWLLSGSKTRKVSVSIKAPIHRPLPIRHGWPIPSKGLLGDCAKRNTVSLNEGASQQVTGLNLDQ